QQGDLTTTVTMKRNDEFGDLSLAFNRMLQQIVELIRRAELHNELERKLEIQVLQSQINPHFLYNTLGSISNVIRLGQIEKVDVNRRLDYDSCVQERRYGHGRSH
ncbi:sensor histidine kinase, partial [Paenibacillus sp. TAF58]